MNGLTRREAIKMSMTTGALAVAGMPGAAQAAAAAQDEKPNDAAQDEAMKRDRGFVLAAGMTEGEADCWEYAAKTAGAFFDLPELHPMDKQEVATAIHVIQNKLLSRPTFRKYLENAKRALGE